MSLPKSKFLHRPANSGACVLDLYHEIHAHKFHEPGAPSICMEIADEASKEAQKITTELFDFWRLLQGAHVDLQMIHGHWNVFKAMRRWPG